MFIRGRLFEFNSRWDEEESADREVVLSFRQRFEGRVLTLTWFALCPAEVMRGLEAPAKNHSLQLGSHSAQPRSGFIS